MNGRWLAERPHAGILRPPRPPSAGVSTRRPGVEPGSRFATPGQALEREPSKAPPRGTSRDGVRGGPGPMYAAPAEPPGGLAGPCDTTDRPTAQRAGRATPGYLARLGEAFPLHSLTPSDTYPLQRGFLVFFLLNNGCLASEARQIRVWSTHVPRRGCPHLHGVGMWVVQHGRTWKQKYSHRFWSGNKSTRTVRSLTQRLGLVTQCLVHQVGRQRAGDRRGTSRRRPLPGVLTCS